MRFFKTEIKPLVILLLVITMVYNLMPIGFQNVFAEENEEVKTENVTGTVYQFGEKGTYDLSKSKESYSTDTGTVSWGQFSIRGSISSVTEKDGMPAYSVNGGLLKFSYIYDDKLLSAEENKNHLVNDDGKKVNNISLGSEIKKGALIVQTSKDGKIWYTVSGSTITNLFSANPDGVKKFYTTTDVQMVNGCYYRIIIAYKTGIRIQKAQTFPPKLEIYEYKKYAEVYQFYAYDETAVNIPVPEDKNRRNLGTKVRTKREGYAGSAAMDNDDPHFGWDIGQFFVGGYTDYENDADGNPIFLKNNGDRLSLWFELLQDIDKCYGNSAIKVIADQEGSDADFEIPGGVNETTDFKRGALIVRKTNPDGTKESPQLYTDYLVADASVDAVTKVDLLEEGDYEVALDYAIKFDKTKILGKSILPEIAKYKIAFKFSVRNGNSMIFLFDKGTGSELSSGSITENGFKLDFANSQYLRVNVKREVLKDGFDGLTEDTRFNSVATDGDEFTDEGVYTITVTNRDLKNIDPTVKKVYVGTDNILKAYVVNNIPVAKLKEMVAMGAVIADDGTIIEPESETEELVETSVEETAVESEAGEEEAADSASVEKTIEDTQDQNQGKTNNNTSSPVIPISVVTVILVAGGFFLKSRSKK